MAAVSEREMSERIEKMGLVPRPQTLDEASRFVAAEGEKWARAVVASGATAE
ncbi:MAG: hypothetical protein JO292_12760 [Betaproteobacteria bacterium]|nr:hypothetical protein [Betaproteobacteria bacterium]MBV9362253.1 hypothetical protein [Betaproteobacteria bacterium]